MDPTVVLPPRHRRVAWRRHTTIPAVDIVIPVLNEAATLAQSVRRLRAHLGGQLGFCGRIIIADNGSTDATLKIAAGLAELFDNVSVLHLSACGRGRALRTAWLASTADVVAYMDVDLSTDLAQLAPLVRLITRGGADLAIGSRLLKGSRITRGPRREIISRSYNRLLRIVLRVGFHDAQCGFKAVRGEVARGLVPLVEDNGWFFDTELLVRAEQHGYTIAELPVSWTDDPDSRVAILKTAWHDLRGIARLRTEGIARGRLARFAGVGVASTLLYSGIFAGLAHVTTAVAANAIALVLSTGVNTEANRLFTFGVRGGERRMAAHLTGVAALLFGLLMTTGALGVVRLFSERPAIVTELAATLLAAVLATVVRYLLLQRYAVPTDDPSGGAAAASPPPSMPLAA